MLILIPVYTLSLVGQKGKNLPEFFIVVLQINSGGSIYYRIYALEIGAAR